MLLLIGPAVAVIGIVAVVFVMRHKAVEKRSMYSARRSQIEHKVRAARQRTLAPGKRSDKASRTSVEEASAPAPTLTYEPSAFAAPPVASPPKKGFAAPAEPAWDTGPAAEPQPITPTFTPTPPAYETPAAPPYESPAAPPYEAPAAPPYEAPAAPPYEAPAAPPYEAPPSYEAPTYAAPTAEPAWNPAAAAPEAPPEQVASTQASSTSAGAGASWSVVGETKSGAEAEPDTKKKSKDAKTGAWQLSSGEAAGEETDDGGPKKPTAVVAIAQYAVLVVGLVMVLIGVVVMVANSHPG
jgi:hypothetical protein